MKKIIKILPLAAPLILLTSCSARFSKSEDYLQKLEFEKSLASLFENNNEKTEISKKIEMLLNHNIPWNVVSKDDKFQIIFSLGNDKEEGRIVEIPHMGHTHLVWKSYKELPRREWETNASFKNGYVLSVKKSDEITFSNMKEENYLFKYNQEFFLSIYEYLMKDLRKETLSSDYKNKSVIELADLYHTQFPLPYKVGNFAGDLAEAIFIAISENHDLINKYFTSEKGEISEVKSKFMKNIFDFIKSKNYSPLMTQKISLPFGALEEWVKFRFHSHEPTLDTEPEILEDFFKKVLALDINGDIVKKIEAMMPDYDMGFNIFLSALINSALDPSSGTLDELKTMIKTKQVEEIEFYALKSKNDPAKDPYAKERYFTSFDELVEALDYRISQPNSNVANPLPSPSDKKFNDFISKNKFIASIEEIYGAGEEQAATGNVQINMYLDKIARLI